MRGPGGGYLLGRDADQIFVAEVIAAVDESVDATRCQGNKEGCQNGDRLTHALWRDLSDRITSFLAALALMSWLKTKKSWLLLIDKITNSVKPCQMGLHLNRLSMYVLKNIKNCSRYILVSC